MTNSTTTTTQVTVTGGSDKQIAYASDIVSKWLSQIDAEISQTSARPVSDGVAWYADALTSARAVLVAGVSKMSAKQIIDFSVATGGPVATIIANARKAAH